jgi:hypothetical protein
MGETPELTLTPTPNRAHDLLRSEGLNLPARDTTKVAGQLGSGRLHLKLTAETAGTLGMPAPAGKSQAGRTESATALVLA